MSKIQKQIEFRRNSHRYRAGQDMGLYLVSRRINQLLKLRGISTTSVTMQDAVENLKTNPYYEKYANRIAELQKTSPEELKARVEQQQSAREEEKRKKFASVDMRQYSSALNPKETLKDTTISENKKLSDIFKIELVEDKDGSEIQNIWEEYHNHKEVISATIPTTSYSEMQKKMREYPTFLFPLPRSQGYEFILCQSFGHTVHFTPLLAFQVHKENAPECLTIVHYTELSSKGLILMRGDYDKNVLNGQEAQCLANQFQLYYNGKDEQRLQLLQAFTKTPDHFKHMDLVSQLENIVLV